LVPNLGLSVPLLNVLAANVLIAEGPLLFEKADVNKGKSLTFSSRNPNANSFKQEGHNLKPLQPLIRKVHLPEAS
jgi:hypothetical protein